MVIPIRETRKWCHKHMYTLLYCILSIDTKRNQTYLFLTSSRIYWTDVEVLILGRRRWHFRHSGHRRRSVHCRKRWHFKLRLLWRNQHNARLWIGTRRNCRCSSFPLLNALLNLMLTIPHTHDSDSEDQAQKHTLERRSLEIIWKKKEIFKKFTWYICFGAFSANGLICVDWWPCPEKSSNASSIFTNDLSMNIAIKYIAISPIKRKSCLEKKENKKTNFNNVTIIDHTMRWQNELLDIL